MLNTLRAMSTEQQTLEKEDRAARVSDAIRALEPTPGSYEPCGVEDVDEVYPKLMQDRPRQRPATCPLRRKLVGVYLDSIETAINED